MGTEFLLQWNTSSLVSHWTEFREYMTNKKPLIAAIQETRFLDSDEQNYNFNLFGYSLYTHNINSNPRRGGCALYVSNKILHHQVQFNSTLNYVAINAKIIQRDITFISIYLSPSQNISEQEIDNLFTQIPNPCFMMGDYNSHHPAWGCTSTNNRGNTLHRLIDEHNLTYLNNQTPTHITMRNGTAIYSAIDLALTTPNIAPLFSFHVQPDPLFSDHYPIHIHLETPSGQTDFNFLPRWNLNKADWTKFQNHIDETHTPNSNPDLNHFLNTILASAHQSIPHTHHSTRHKHAPWWNDDCQRALAIRRRALRAFQRCICRVHEAEARRARWQAENILNKNRKESWEKFSNTFNRFTPLSKIWSLIKCFTTNRSRSYKIPHLIINNRHYSIPFEVATKFATHYANVSATSQYTHHLHSTLTTRLATLSFHSTNTEDYNLPFQIYELKLALSKCGNTSVGPDQLAYPFFKNLTESGLNNLLFGLNQIWTNEQFPDTWKQSTLIPILKPTKPTSDPASYRPISLSSCASKLMERMVNGRLRTYIESNQLLTPYQNGFRPGYSTADGLAHLINTVQTGFQSKHATVALFLDLKAAFDKVHHSALMIKIHKTGIRGRLATFIKNFLSDRTFTVRCGNTYSPSHQQEHGVPQGCVLSPTLFLILINDIFDNINQISPHFKFSLYADDIAIWYTHPSVDEANKQIQHALDHISNWCSLWGLQISPAKSATVIFSKSIHINPLLPLTINGENIPIVKTFKFLGIMLDRSLTFKHHIDYLKQKCSRRINILKCIAGRDWGADRSTLLKLYTSLIRPILEYNAFLFDTISDTHIATIEAIQNTSLRIVTGALRTTPVPNLRAETNIPSLESRRKYLLLRFYIRTLSRPNKPTYHIVTNLPENTVFSIEQRRCPSLPMRIQKSIELFRFTKPLIAPVPRLRSFWTEKPPVIEYLFTQNKQNILPTEIRGIFAEFQDQHPNHFFIFTDGSRMEGRTGAAFVTPQITRSRRLPDIFSVYSAELSAILSAIAHIKYRNIPRSIICSDSKSSLQALSAYHNSSHPWVHKIQLLLASLPNHIQIKFLWIPSHVGIHGNEKADEAAKLSIQLPPNNNMECPATDALNILHTKFLQFLQFDWDMVNHFHLHPIKPEIQHWSSCHQNTRLKEIILARLRLGHTKLTHSHITENRPPSNCTRCHVVYSIHHFLIVCPRYQREREGITRHVTANRLPLTLPSLLGDSNPELLDLVFKFLHETKLENFI